MANVISFIIFLILFFFPKNAVAVNMDSSQYRIKFGNIGIAGGNKSSSNYKLADSLGQLAAGEFQSSGYIVKAGFQYLHSIIPFKFSISDIQIDLGSLLADTPSTGTTTLTVSFGSAGQYQVTVAEQTTLKTLTNKAIPNTSCDGGTSTCLVSLAKVWSSTSAYGFGYNMSGQDIPSDFIDSTYYRPFANLSNSENPVIIMSNQNVGKDRQSTMTFKVNRSAIQEAGSYQTVIEFVATAGY